MCHFAAVTPLRAIALQIAFERTPVSRLLRRTVAKTFDNVWEASTTNYLFLFTQMACSLNAQPPVPPPLSALSLLYEGVELYLACRGVGMNGRAEKKQGDKADAAGSEVDEHKKQERSKEHAKKIEERGKQIAKYIEENQDEVAQEERWRTRLQKMVSAKFASQEVYLKTQLKVQSERLEGRLERLEGRLKAQSEHQHELLSALMKHHRLSVPPLPPFTAQPDPEDATTRRASVRASHAALPSADAPTASANVPSGGTDFGRQLTPNDISELAQQVESSRDLAELASDLSLASRRKGSQCDASIAAATNMVAADENVRDVALQERRGGHSFAAFFAHRTATAASRGRSGSRVRFHSSFVSSSSRASFFSMSAAIPADSHTCATVPRKISDSL